MIIIIISTLRIKNEEKLGRRSKHIFLILGVKNAQRTCGSKIIYMASNFLNSQSNIFYERENSKTVQIKI